MATEIDSEAVSGAKEATGVAHEALGYDLEAMIVGEGT